MTDHVARLYVALAALVVFFLTWAVVAAKPWTAPGQDPRVQALAAREARIARESVRVKQLVDRRWIVYRARLGERNRAIAALKAQAAAQRKAAAASAARTVASRSYSSGGSSSYSAAPRVRVVTLPPLTVTRTS